MKKQDTETQDEPKYLSKKQKIWSSVLLTGGFSGFAIPAIYSLTIGTLSSTASLLSTIAMYFLCFFGIVLAVPLMFSIFYWLYSQKISNKTYSSPRRHKKVPDSWYQDPARSCMKGNYYHR